MITVWEVASAFVERQMVQQKVLPVEGAECDMEHPLCDLGASMFAHRVLFQQEYCIHNWWRVGKVQ